MAEFVIEFDEREMVTTYYALRQWQILVNRHGFSPIDAVTTTERGPEIRLLNVDEIEHLVQKFKMETFACERCGGKGWVVDTDDQCNDVVEACADCSVFDNDGDAMSHVIQIAAATEKAAKTGVS